MMKAISQMFGEESKTYTAGDLANSNLEIDRSEEGMGGIPVFDIEVRIGDQSWSSIWPESPLTERDLRQAVGWEQPKVVTDDAELPKQPDITTTKVRVAVIAPSDQPRTGLLLGDVLEAIADQSGKDVIADYYLQETLFGKMAKTPVDQVIKQVSERLGYTCQVSGSTLRFRANDWYMQEPMREPPARLIDNLWASLCEDGFVGTQDLIDLVGLPRNELSWPGLKLIYGSERARTMSAPLQFLRSLDSSQYNEAQSQAGLLLAKLADSQMAALLVAPEMSYRKLSASEVSQYWLKVGPQTIRSHHKSPTRGEWEDDTQLNGAVIWKNATEHLGWLVIVRQPIPESVRKQLADQRKADAEADKVEVVR